MNADPNQVAQLDSLIFSVLLHGLSDSEEQQLDELLNSNVALRRRYLERMFVAGELSFSSNLASRAASQQFAERSAPAPASGLLARAARVAGRPLYWSVLATSVLFAGYVIAISWNMLGGQLPNGPADDELAVAEITAGPDVKWQKTKTDGEAQTSAVPAGTIRAHQPLAIESGHVDLQLKQGATLSVEGPAEWVIDGENAATLTYGKVVARVPERAVGFALTTPMATIVDLGTEFSVHVSNAGETRLQVNRGLVEVAQNQNSTGRKRVAAGEAQRIIKSPVDGSLVFERVEFDPAQVAAKATSESPLERWRAASQKLRTDPSLVAYYDFEGDDKVLKNVLADRLHGEIITERAEIPWTDGRWHGKGALAFGKDFSTVAVTDHPDLAPEDARSIALWLRIDALPPKGFALIAGKGNFPKRSFGFWHHAYGQLLFGFGNISGRQFGGQSPKPLSMNEWHFAVGIIDTGEVRLYLDGRKVAAQQFAGSVATDDAPLMLGRSREPSNPHPFTGAIDELAIYSRALNPAEIEEMYRKGKPTR